VLLLLQVVWDGDGELKVLFAWNADTVVVTFRGSTTAANWVADAMVSQQHSAVGTAKLTHQLGKQVGGGFNWRCSYYSTINMQSRFEWCHWWLWSWRFALNRMYLLFISAVIMCNVFLYSNFVAQLWRSAHPHAEFQAKQASMFNKPKIHTGFLRWVGCADPT
jgi:hypothetical protein